MGRAESARRTSRSIKPLRDGAILAGVDGTLAKDPDNKWWFSRLKPPLPMTAGDMTEGQAVEVLRSSTLEKMHSVMKNSKADFRIWGRVTQFEGKNFIFPVYFLIIIEAAAAGCKCPFHSKTHIDQRT